MTPTLKELGRTGIFQHDYDPKRTLETTQEFLTWTSGVYAYSVIANGITAGKYLKVVLQDCSFD